MTRPVAMTCGEPAGIGPELAMAARRVLGGSLPFFWIGDPRHLPQGPWQAIDDPLDAMGVAPDVLPVLVHDLGGDAGAELLLESGAEIDLGQHAEALLRQG